MRVIVELSEPWDWNPPTIEVDLDDSTNSDDWPKLAAIVAVKMTNADPPAGTPPTGTNIEGLIGGSVELRLRHHHDVPPTIADRPTVYATVVDNSGERRLIGYGRIA